MSKVNFEYDENEENYEIQLITNRHTLMKALYDLADYRRNLYKGYNNKYIIVKDNEVVYKEGQKIKEYDIEAAKTYLDDNDVIDKLDDILDQVRHLLDM